MHLSEALSADSESDSEAIAKVVALSEALSTDSESDSEVIAKVIAGKCGRWNDRWNDRG